MNVACTQCQTIFRVDPAKVPRDGVRARCSVCAGIFWVRQDSAPPLRPATQPATQAAPPAPVFARPSAPPAAVPQTFRPAAPPAPAVSPPAASPSAPGAPAVRPAAPQPSMAPAAVMAPATDRPKRPTNPFLSQDPAARARRLARALVSDIVVYHPAKRRDGLRDGSLKILFEDEIRKSWEEYVEQVGRELAEASTFFTDALNEILADGQPVFP